MTKHLHHTAEVCRFEFLRPYCALRALIQELIKDSTKTLADIAASGINGNISGLTGLVASDLGAADVTLDFSNTNAVGSPWVTNLTTDGTVSATLFSGNLTGNVTGNADTATTAATVTGAAQTAITSVGTLTSLAIDGNLTLGPTTSHIVSTQTATPTVTSDLGTGNTMTAGSTDTAGQVTSTAVAHNAVTVTFNATYGTAPFCVISAGDVNAAAVAGDAGGVYVTTTATTMVINSVPATASAQVWNYHCVGK